MTTFDPTAYYRFYSDMQGNLSLSLGMKSIPPPAPFLSASGSFSSENWQLFYDSGVYFIRNYDYGADYQLGITEGNRSIPTMLRSNGTLGMQWNLTQWNDGNTGTWRFTNGLLGFSDAFFLDVEESNGDEYALAINADTSGAHWTIDINVSAGKITNSSQLTGFESIQTAPATAATATAATTTASSTSRPTISPSTKSNTISGGAIAGIVIGVVALILLVLALFFFRRRRRNQRHLARSVSEKVMTPTFSDKSTAEAKGYQATTPVLRSELASDKMDTRSELATAGADRRKDPTEIPALIEMPADGISPTRSARVKA